MRMLLHTLMPRLSGVHRHVWGYPTPIAEEETNRVAFVDDSAYESQVLKPTIFTFGHLADRNIAPRSVPIHTDSYSRCHQARSPTLLPPRLLPPWELYFIWHRDYNSHRRHNLVDNRYDYHECPSMR